jgi:cell division protein FtsB
MTRSLVLLILVVLLGWLQYRLWGGQGSLQELHQLHLAVDRQSAEVVELQARNQDLRAEVDDLREGRDAVEERARSDLGMIRKKETFFLVVEEE